MGNQRWLTDDHRGTVLESNMFLPLFIAKATTTAPATAVPTRDLSGNSYPVPLLCPIRMAEAVVDQHEEYPHWIESGHYDESSLGVHQAGGELEIKQHAHGHVFPKHQQVEGDKQIPGLAVLHVEVGEDVDGGGDEIEGNLQAPATLEQSLGSTAIRRTMKLDVGTEGGSLQDQEEKHEYPVSTDDHEDPVAVGKGENGEGYHTRGHDTQVPQALNDVGR
jgi:hypothetical protein